VSLSAGGAEDQPLVPPVFCSIVAQTLKGGEHMPTLKPGDKAPVSSIYQPAKRPGTPVAISQGETLPPTPNPHTDWKLKTPANPPKR